jgi:2-keto-4-pentenoate hydratase/2-oxohepta-3-ene-1,7-dioic acid hydratase in catechol pathway
LLDNVCSSVLYAAVRLVRAQTNDGPLLAVERGEEIHDLGLPPGADLGTHLQRGTAVLTDLATKAGGKPLSPFGLAAPIRPGKIVAVGLNYLDHIRESGVDPPNSPLLFAKFPSTVIGPEEPILLNPAIASRVDWEVELAVVIGHELRFADPEEAMNGVFGYTIANDVSARDVQFGDGQWIRGKNLDSFCPLGPCVVTVDEVPYPQRLSLQTRVNGEVVQDSSTSEMLFSVGEILAFCSRNFTLEPGDVVLTGTPWGVGEFMDPPRSLQPGDRVAMSIEGIGTLGNPVRELPDLRR